MSIESRSVQLGSVFEHWQIQESLGWGSGGRSVVFRLVHNDSSWHDTCALKIMSLIEEQGSLDNMPPYRRQEYEEMLCACSQNAEQEVRLMASLRGNTNIVDYLDYKFVDWSDDSGFGRDILIRMELLRDLRSEMRSGKIYSEAEVIKLGRDICTALVLCHSKNILHRDIKPENIFMNADGNYKLGDFGISRILNASPLPRASTGIGTPEYAAPEQIKGQYDHRVDIYSLGLVLYELCNRNRLPFATTSYACPEEVWRRHTGEPLPKPIYASDDMTRIILKACAHNVEDRYQTARDFLQALNAIAGERGMEVDSNTTVPLEDPYGIPRRMPALDASSSAELPKAPAKKKRRNRKLAVLGLVIVLAVMAIVIISIFSGGGWKRLWGLSSADGTSGGKPHVHAYNAVITAPTCVRDGYTTFTCDCGDSYDAYPIKATGHSFGSWKITTAATCTVSGEKQSVCEACGYAQKENVEAFGHRYGSWYDVEAATCTETGIKRRICEACDETETVTVASTGHSYSYQVETAPTKTAHGVLRGSCEKCQRVQTLEIPMLNMEEYTYTEVRIATSVRNGLETYVWNETQYGVYSFDVEQPRLVDTSVVAQGQCGDNVYWKLGNAGTLTIYGSGEMLDYKEENTPWYSYRKDILAVVVEDGVETIGSLAFHKFSRLLDVSISESVWKIGSAVFMQCYSLTEIEIPEGVTYLDGNIFWECSALQFVTLPARATYMGGYMFHGCSNLIRVEIPKGVTTIEMNTFEGCDSLEEVVIPDSVTAIEMRAFYMCHNLKNIKLSANLEMIDMEAFYCCESLERIVLPDSVTELGRDAFGSCSSLVSVRLSEKLIELKGYLFSYCEKLRVVYVPATVERIDSLVFEGCDAICHVLYGGTQQQWDWIYFDDVEYNELAQAPRHYNCTGDEVQDNVCSICGDRCT